MTALVGGSLLLIVGAAIALVIGWVAADESLIWASIGASIAAAVMLSLGYHRSKAEAARRPPPEPGAAPPPAVAPRAATPPAARRDASPTQETPMMSGDADDAVVAYPDRSRFHRPECRYASLPGGEKISRDAAMRRGYDPCRVCKP